MTTIFLTICLALLQSPPLPASIQGRVVRAGTTQTIARARVLAAPVVGAPNDPLATSIAVEAPSVPIRSDGTRDRISTMKITGSMQGVFTTLTDSNGAFTFKNLPPASYRLFVEHDDYLFGDFGQLDVPTPTVVVIPITPTSTIFGRVVDQYGDPQQAFKVRALTPTYDQGQPKMTVVRETQTDDLGEFRLYGLAPGRYYVGAFPPQKPRLVSDPTFSDAYAPGLGGGGVMNGPPAIAAGRVPTSLFALEMKLPAYFGGSSEDTATSIDLAVGALFDAGKITAMRVSSIHVRGQFIDGRTGQAVTNVSGGGSATPLSPRGVTIPASASNGSFDFFGLLPGTYAIRGTSSDRLSGELEIVVRNTDIDNLRVILRPPANLRLQVTPGFAQVQVTLTSTRIPGLTFKVPIPPEGSVTVPNVLSGDYRLGLTSSDDKAYLKAAQLGTTDVLINDLHVDNSISDTLQIVIGPNGGTLDGAVSDDESRMVQGSTIVLVPDGSQKGRVDLYRHSVTDTAGKAHFGGLTPGDYVVFAWKDVLDGAWLNPEFMSQYEGRGQAIHIGEGDTLRVSVKLK